MTKITVYGSDQCPPCRSLKQFLKNKGISFEYIDVTKDERGTKKLVEKNIFSIPVIEIGDKTIIGFNKEELNKLIS